MDPRPFSTLRNTKFTYKPAFDAFKTKVLAAVDSYDSTFATSDPSSATITMVNAFPATVDTARASLDKLGGFLFALEQDVAAVLVWAIGNPSGSEDVSPTHFSGAGSWLNI